MFWLKKLVILTPYLCVGKKNFKKLATNYLLTATIDNQMVTTQKVQNVVLFKNETH